MPDWRAALADIDSNTLQGRAETRCASPDYTPIAGPASRNSAVDDAFRELRHNARATPQSGGQHWRRDLYLCTAFGSRGLTYAALSGELVASQLFGEIPPLARYLHRATSPARFKIRAMIRGEDHQSTET